MGFLVLGLYIDEETDHLMMGLAEVEGSYSKLQFAKVVEKLLARVYGGA